MNKITIENFITSYIEKSALNTIGADKALTEEMVGLVIWDKPLIGYAAADNEYIGQLKNIPEANIEMDIPEFWLPGAESVISFFLPYTSQIRKSNIPGDAPSTQWLHGRIDGQNLINALLKDTITFLEKNGYDAMSPLFDERFSPKMGRDTKENDFGSNWSERHAAYAAGLGTFSLSKGLITEKGIAGRFGSIITTAEFEPSIPSHDELYGNCTMCGACIKRCPKQVISLEKGKLHKPCSDYLDDILDANPPYYGCGKCQVGVPCEDRIPVRKT